MIQSWRVVMLVGLCLLSGCTVYRQVTPELFKELDLSKVSPQDVQYYISHDLVLRRVLRKGETVTQGAKVVTIKEKKIVELEIECKTPCVLLRQYAKVPERGGEYSEVDSPYWGGYLVMQFEPGVNFGLIFDDRYHYRYYLSLDQNVKVRYDGKLWKADYNTVDGIPFLLYNPDDVRRQIEESRTLPGVKVGSRVRKTEPPQVPPEKTDKPGQ